MKSGIQAQRIALDKTAAEHLSNMMATLRKEGSHLSLVYSKAVSWIVSEFATRYFHKDKQKMIDALFNRKAFLRSVLGNINSGSDEELESIESTIKSLRRGRPAKVPAEQTECQTQAKTPFNSDDL